MSASLVCGAGLSGSGGMSAGRVGPEERVGAIPSAVEEAASFRERHSGSPAVTDPATPAL